MAKKIRIVIQKSGRRSAFFMELFYVSVGEEAPEKVPEVGE
tara:strand:+ start:150 stop:272 length:123 start_codon:yes stop_codon:yes gene_type:complete